MSEQDQPHAIMSVEQIIASIQGTKNAYMEDMKKKRKSLELKREAVRQSIEAKQLEEASIEQSLRDLHVEESNTIARYEATLLHFTQGLEAYHQMPELLGKPKSDKDKEGDPKSTSEKEVHMTPRLQRWLSLAFQNGIEGPDTLEEMIMVLETEGINLDSLLARVFSGWTIKDQITTAREDLAKGLESMIRQFWARDWRKIVTLHDNGGKPSLQLYRCLYNIQVMGGDPQNYIWEEERYQKIFVEKMGNRWGLAQVSIK